MLHYIKFVAFQLGHMRLNNYCLLFFAMGAQLMILLNAPINWITLLTFIGTLLGTTCVIAINASKSVNGWLGILSGICFIIIGFSAKNYLSIGEQIAYMITLDLPVLCSVDWNSNLASKIRHFTWRNWIISIAFTVAVAIISGLLICHYTDDPRPVFDSISFSISLTGGIVCWLRYSNQYFWWTAGSIAQIVLWVVTFKQGSANAGMLINYLIYFANDILAFTLSPWYNKYVRKEVIAKNNKLDL